MAALWSVLLVLREKWMKSLPIDRPTLDDPVYDQKNPYQVFLLTFTLIAIAPKFLGGQSPSQVMQAGTSSSTLFFWMSCLTFGSIVGLVGEFWRGHTWTSLAVERAGLALVGFPGLIFAWVVHRSNPGHTQYITGVTLAYSLASLWRVLQITRRLRWIRKIVEEYNRQSQTESAST